MNTDRLSQQQAVKLIGEAFVSQKRAYAPYSHFQVGAALLCRETEVFTEAVTLKMLPMEPATVRRGRLCSGQFMKRKRSSAP